MTATARRVRAVLAVAIALLVTVTACGDSGDTTTRAGGPSPPVLGSFSSWLGGGAPPLCDEFVLGVDLPYLGPDGRTGWQLGSVMPFCAIGFGGGPVDVVVTFPDGGEQSFRVVLNTGANSPLLRTNPFAGDELRGEFDSLAYWFLSSSYEPGVYRFTAVAPAQASTEVTLGRFRDPGVAKVTLDAGVPIGSRLFVALYGFEPNEEVPLAFYADTGARETDDLCTDNCTRFELLDDLGLFSTDGLGTSLRELDIDDRFEPGRAYCITSPLVDRGFCDSFGPGWFVVN